MCDGNCKELPNPKTIRLQTPKILFYNVVYVNRVDQVSGKYAASVFRDKNSRI
jgi:hypothetical protein